MTTNAALKYTAIKCNICAVPWDEHDPSLCPHGRKPDPPDFDMSAYLDALFRLTLRESLRRTITGLERKQRSLRHRWFASVQEHDDLNHALSVLRKEVSKP